MIPADFYTQIESNKWGERKEALEAIEKAIPTAELQNADINELVRVLKKTLSKDSNIVVATQSAKCLCQLAQSLRTSFSPFANSCLSVIFEKFKEKKPNVLTVMRDTADAVFVSTNLENILDDVILFLGNKNPQIKAEMANFLARVFSKFPAQVMNKRTLRPLINALIKTLSDMDAAVRESSAQAIGTAMKVAGEKVMMTLIADVEPIKLPKIKEYCQSAVIITEQQTHTNGVEADNAEIDSQNTPNGQTNELADDDDDEDSDAAFDKLGGVDISSRITAEFYSAIESKKWSDRKEALDIVEKATSVPKIEDADFNELVRVLKKTLAKDSNIVVATSAAKCLCQLAQGLRANFAPFANSCLSVIFEKFKEKKPNVLTVMRDTADAVFVATNLESVMEDTLLFLNNKNPQIKAEMANFLARVFSKFPAQVMNKKTLRPLINALIKTLSDMDAAVRESSALAIGTAMKVTGEKVMMTLIADVEPIKLPKIKEYCQKAQIKKMPRSQIAATITAPTPLTNGFTEQAPTQATRSATITRSKTKITQKRPPITKVNSKLPPPAAPVSNATVKRTATITKRTTVTRKPSGLPQARSTQALASVPQQQQQPQPQQQQPIMQSNEVAPLPTPAKPSYATVQLTKLSKQDQLDLLLIRLISRNPDKVLESLSELNEMLVNSESERLLGARIDELIDLASMKLSYCVYQLKQHANSENQSQQESSQILRSVCDLLKQIFSSRKVLLATVEQQTICTLLLQLFTFTQASSNISNNIRDPNALKNLNELGKVVIGAFEPPEIVGILTGLLNDPSVSPIVEAIKKAIICSMKALK